MGLIFINIVFPYFSKNFGFLDWVGAYIYQYIFFYILEATESRIKTSDYKKTLDQKKITLKNDLKADYEWILTAELARAEP
ncbi:Hypothetical protein HPV225_p0004 (plasmid) [Helicobacter pylori v225d]|nr:Hypothetical protein HPV225_p0004 [Helicobacter pylori v225d]